MKTALSAPVVDTPHQDELNRLEILRSYKTLFGGDGTANRSPFAEHRVVCYDTNVAPWDVPEIYREARDSITQALGELHRNHLPNVVVLAGEPGMGKSHLINHFRNPELQKELGYVLVGNSNHWKVEEFESCLLTSMVSELLRPDANGPNLLLSKIETIAFEALNQILTQPGKINDFLGKQRGLATRFRSLRKLFRGDATTRFLKVVKDRDVKALRELNFLKFADFICDRFLHQRTNPFHRFVLHVLLRFLYPEDRRFVAAWLAGMNVDASFMKKVERDGKEPADPAWPTAEQAAEHLQAKLGLSDLLDCNYKVIDTVKILISLFATQIGQVDEAQRDPLKRVFFFAFDQIEGRNELFDTDRDWFKFFAKLSELYNSLPNVYILFTMTLGLRNDLYPRMERQFQQRIHRDQKFVLQGLDDGDIFAIYRKHLDSWRNGQLTHLEELFAQPQFQYLPFTQDKVLENGRQKTIREMLDAFDQGFRAVVMDIPLKDARLEYLIALNEFRETEGKPNAHKYVSDHLDLVLDLLEKARSVVSGDPDLQISDCKMIKTEEGDYALLIEFRCPKVSEEWVRVFLALVPWKYEPVERLIKLLSGRQKDRYFLWLIRAESMKPDCQNRRPGQIFPRDLQCGVHSRFLALRHLLNKHHQLEEAGETDWDDRGKFSNDTMETVQNEVKETYLGELCRHARAAFDRLGEKANADE